jgi:hypothetical protein
MVVEKLSAIHDLVHGNKLPDKVLVQPQTQTQSQALPEPQNQSRPPTPAPTQQTAA